MLGFVDHLLVRGLEAPLLLVATTRPELLSQHEGPLTSARSGRLRRLHLRGLAKRHAEVLVAALLGTGSSQGARRTVAHAAGGNPLYAEQIARLLVDRSFAESGHQQVSGHTEVLEETPLPDSLKGVLAARMDTLPRATKTFLSDAAVLGETFWRGGLIALSGAAESDVDAGLAVLLARDFVRPVRTSSIAGDREYLFWHALSRDAAYGQLSRKARASKHRAAAVWLEESAQSRDDALSEIVAHHYTAALEFARASRDVELANALMRPAIAALTRAVDRALRLDVRAAERYLAQALELAGEDGPARLALLPRRAKLLLVTDHYREAAEAFDQAVTALLDAGDIRQAALALSWQSDALATLREPTMALQNRALELLADDGPSAELAEILSRYALALIINDEDPRLVLATADRAITMASSLGLPEPALALSTRGMARLDLGHLAGEEDLRRAERAAQEQGLGIERSTILLNHTGTAFLTRGAVAERDAVSSGHEFVSRHGLTAYADSFRSALIHCAYKMGEWDECLASVAEALPRVVSIDDQWDLLFLRSLLTMIAEARGRAAEAAEHLVWLVEQGGPCEVGWARSYALLAAAMGHVGLGDRAAARTVLEVWLDKPQGIRAVHDAVPEAIRTARAADERLAYAIADEFERAVPPVMYPLTELVRGTERALIAELRHEYEAAAAGFADAAAGWQAFVMPYEQAHALYGQGRCLSALGRAPEAAAPLAAARGIFARLGAKPALAQVDGLLRDSERLPH